MTLPLAVVGMDFREGPTSLRRQLLEVDSSESAPHRELVTAGAAKGVARIVSCSRVEWVVSSEQPGWAAELLRGALLSRVGDAAAGRTLHVKTSLGAANYLFRIALGLESVAEGEHAIGRQVLRGFETAHTAGTTDRTLHLCWHAVGRLLQVRRTGGVGTGVGVQSLVVRELETLAVDKQAKVRVLGQGEIGRSVLEALRSSGYRDVQGHSRATMSEFTLEAQDARVVVVCTGAPAAHLTLPARGDLPLVVDIGAPRQLKDTPGWQRMELDELLTRRGLLLDLAELTTLQALADEGAEGLAGLLEDDGGTSRVLSALEAEKRRLFDEELDEVLARLPPKEARELAARLRGFTHRLVEATRRAGRE